MSFDSTPFAGTVSSVPSESFTLVISPNAAQAVLAAAVVAIVAAVPGAFGAVLAAGGATGAVTAGVPGPLSAANRSQARISAPRIDRGTSHREPLAAAESVGLAMLYLPYVLCGVKAQREKKPAYSSYMLAASAIVRPGRVRATASCQPAISTARRAAGMRGEKTAAVPSTAAIAGKSGHTPAASPASSAAPVTVASSTAGRSARALSMCARD